MLCGRNGNEPVGPYAFWGLQFSRIRAHRYHGGKGKLNYNYIVRREVREIPTPFLNVDRLFLEQKWPKEKVRDGSRNVTHRDESWGNTFRDTAYVNGLGSPALTDPEISVPRARARAEYSGRGPGGTVTSL
jgi:hypothetical protein